MAAEWAAALLNSSVPSLANGVFGGLHARKWVLILDKKGDHRF